MQNHSRKIVFRNGNSKDMDLLFVGEIGYCNDTQEYWVGTPNGNKPFDDFRLLADGIHIEKKNDRFIIGIVPENRNKL